MQCVTPSLITHAIELDLVLFNKSKMKVNRLFNRNSPEKEKYWPNKEMHNFIILFPNYAIH